MNLYGLITLISGIYFIIFSMLNSTNNFTSALIYRILPFLFGVGCMGVGLALLNIISLNLK